MNMLLFRVGPSRCAVPSERVVEIVRAVAVTHLPGAPEVIEGIIDVRGTVAPVYDLRFRLGIDPRPIVPSDNFILVRRSAGPADGSMMALHTDEVLDLADIDSSLVVDPREQVTAVRGIAGVALLPDGLTLIHDLDAFLSGSEAELLDNALAGSDLLAKS